MFNLFKKKKAERQKRDFTKVPWPWKSELNGKPVPPFHLFCFANGYGVLVLKNSCQTYDGMMCVAIDDFLPSGLHRPATWIVDRSGVEIYTRAEGLSVPEVYMFCKKIKNAKGINK